MATPEVNEVVLPNGTLRYRAVGDGAPIVFVHGLLANGQLWHDVLFPLAEAGYRCIAPDLPLGGHSIPLPPEADRTPGGIARMLGDFCDALGVRDITLVGNDTGGALCQILISQRPELVARLVLTNCDAFEQFFPPLIQPLFHALPARFGEGYGNFLAALLRSRFAQRVLLATVSKRRYDAAALDSYFAAYLRQRAIRVDAIRFMEAVSPRYTVDAAQTFEQFQAPVLLAWGQNDLFFSRRLARRLEAAFPHATLKWVQGSRAFVPEDQPQVLVQLIQEFLHAPTTQGVAPAEPAR